VTTTETADRQSPGGSRASDGHHLGLLHGLYYTYAPGRGNPWIGSARHRSSLANCNPGQGPLMAIAAVNLSVIVSSRVNDPRMAEQIAGVLIVPILALLFAQLAGLIILGLGQSS